MLSGASHNARTVRASTPGTPTVCFAVRAAATVAGRFGRLGPSLAAKVAQLLGILLLGALTALGPTIIAAVGLVFYWLWSWLAAVVWSPVERRRGTETNWPGPGGGVHV
jgi:hypothetical protein